MADQAHVGLAMPRPSVLTVGMFSAAESWAIKHSRAGGRAVHRIKNRHRQLIRSLVRAKRD